MRAFNSDGRPDGNASKCRARQRILASAGRGRLACLLVHAAWFLMLAPALAADEPDGILQLIGESVRATHHDQAQEPAGTLVKAAKRPDGYDALVADLPYPQTDAPDKLTLEQLETIAKLPPRANRAGMRVHPAMLPLFHDMILHYTGGNYDNAPIHFRLHMPEPFEPGKKYPMVVWLHGAGECGSDNVNQLAHLHHMIPSLVGPKKRDFFLLASQCPHTHGSWEAPERCLTTVRSDGAVECHLTDDPVALGNAPISFTLAMVEAVMRDYPVDPNRVTVAGLSSGGRGVWKILERRPDLFAAAVPIVSWQAIDEKSLREKPLLKKIPIWAIYSSDDSGIDYARREFQRLRDAGCHVHKTEFGVCGHRAWTPAMLQGDIFGWLVSRAKDGDRYYAAESAPTGPDKIGIFADVTVGDMARKPTLAPPKPNRAKEPIKSKPSPPPTYPNPYEPRKTDVAAGTSTVTAGRVTITASGDPQGSYPPPPVYSHPAPASTTVTVCCYQQFDRIRVELVARYLAVGEVDKALAVADKVKHN
ncbi:MAG: prolyl oligopeptidase family serine peptidase, partial [Pirellulales bacterium]|nr:prolyl oligopeptidase family serine peptidase [Pirellulales bacterium]